MSMSDGRRAETTRARGIDRAINVLECLHLAREPLNVLEIARRLDAPRSTTYEIVNRFLEAGILENCGADGKVYFGKSVHFYAIDYLNMHDLVRRARDEVERLARVSNETTQFCMLQGNKYAIMHMRTGVKIFRISSEVGIRLPIPWTASGRLLLGGMGCREIAEFIPPEDFILPNGRRIAMDEFCIEVEAANRKGFCMTSGLVDTFTHCMAASIRDAHGGPVATLCFVLPDESSPKEIRHLRDILVESARSLSTLAEAAVPG